MRVLLINPYYSLSETPSPPLGLAFLAAALEAAGNEVKILDLVVFPHDSHTIPNIINSYRPHIAGVTAVTMTFDNAIAVVKEIKHTDPKIQTMMGGPHVTFCARETLQTHPELDFIVLGEGERTVVELARTLEDGKNRHAVKGIVFRDGAEIRVSAARELIADLDSLPVPAHHRLPLGRYRALGMPISMTTSRGCPFKCIFCVGRKMVGANVRYRNPIKVVDELEYLNTLKFHQINIADDLFTANKKHCLAVCREIIRRDLTLKWTSFARVDTVSADLLAIMKSAGCEAVSFGIESANPEILKTIRKGITLPQVVRAVKMCQRAGIIPYASFILGLPGETPQTIKDTLEFGEQLKEQGMLYGFHLLAPFPGTEIREQSTKYGIRILTNDWSQYHANRSVVETAEVDRQMLNEIVVHWEDEYNQFLADIGKRMQNGEATPQEAAPLVNLERIVLTYDLMMKNVIEREGSWSQTGGRSSDKEALKVLAAKLKDHLDTSAQNLFDTLNHAWQHGSLKCTTANGTVKWNWVDYPDSKESDSLLTPAIVRSAIASK
jgi:radical SAM superfamily enzyme YgiQ (UPF0313 family)